MRPPTGAPARRGPREPPRWGTILAVTPGQPHVADRVAVLSAIGRVLAEPAQLLALLAAAEDDDDALRRVREAYGFDADQAQAVLDLQFRHVTRA